MLMKCAILLAVASSACCLNFSPCSNNPPVPVQVDLDECIDQPCIFVAGEDLNSNITFDAPYDIEEMESTLKVELSKWITLPYPIPKDTCNNLIRGWCPLKAGERATYNFRMELPPFPEGLSFNIEFKITAVLKDNKKDLIACFKFAGKTK